MIGHYDRTPLGRPPHASPGRRQGSPAQAGLRTTFQTSRSSVWSAISRFSGPHEPNVGRAFAEYEG